MNDRVYKTQREKFNAVIEEIEKMRNSGRPCLVGTTSVEISELPSRMRRLRNIPHNVLNAKLHQREADIVAQAGRSAMGSSWIAPDGRAFCDKLSATRYTEALKENDKKYADVTINDVREEQRMLGAVTIATNMAGRGTDIKLTPEVKAAGGLAIIGTERHESRRVDRQLRGRAGRQGDPGSSVFFVSLEDKLMRLFGSERIAKVMDRFGIQEGEVIEAKMVTRSIENAQKKVEENHFGVRKRLLEYDDVMNKQRTVIYEKRRHALMGERIGMDVANVFWDRVVNIIENNDYVGCKEMFLKVLAMECPFTEQEFMETSREKLEDMSYDKVMEAFQRRTERIQTTAWPIIKRVFEEQGQVYERIVVPITDGKRILNIPCDLREAYETECKSIVKQFEKVISLHNIDEGWKENLRLLDELKHSVQNASYEQKDPLLIFKLESVKLFDNMVDDMNDSIAGTLSRGQIPEMAPEQRVQEAAPEAHSQRYQESKGDELVDQNQQAAAQQDTRETAQPQRRQPITRDKLPGRNDLCPCGSGKKFKNCHGRGLV